MEFKVAPSEFLKSKRMEVDLTLREVAELTGFSKGYISRIENGSSTPSLEAIFKLSSALNYDIEDICLIEENFNQNEKIKKLIEESVAKPIPLYEMAFDIQGDISELKGRELSKRIKPNFQSLYTDKIQTLLEIHSEYILELITLSANSTYPFGVHSHKEQKIVLFMLIAWLDKELEEVHCECQFFFHKKNSRETKSVYEKLASLHTLLSDRIEREEFVGKKKEGCYQQLENLLDNLSITFNWSDKIV